MIPLLFLLLSLTCRPVAAQEPELPEPARPLYALSEALDPLLEDGLFSDSRIALQVVQVSTGEEVFAFEPDTALTPASVTKVLTAATALRTLGPAWRFETWLMTDGEISPEGVLEGNLYVKGGGDPTLVVEKLWKMLRDLQVGGVVEIDGNVIFDDSYMEDAPLIPGWDKKVDITNGPAYFAPLGALSINFNSVTIVVAPGAEAGAPARVELDTPAGAAVILESELTTVAKGVRRSLELEREVDPKTGFVTFRLKGRVPLESGVERIYRSVGHPRAHFVGVFLELMKDHDISVGGRYEIGTTPDDATILVSLQSPPLLEILSHVQKYSNNFMAEQVLRAVGAEVLGAPGTTDKGLEVVKTYFDELGIPRDEYLLLNGSGLSRETVLRPTHINSVLVDMARHPTLGPEFLSSLSVAGVDGTLRRRLREADEAGLLRGKTGSLNGVYCLAGVVVGGDGESYAFTFLVNDIRRTGPVRALHDRFAGALLHLGAMGSVGDGGDP